jgi:hypothetical protein
MVRALSAGVTVGLLSAAAALLPRTAPEAAWFDDVRARCNAVEVGLALRDLPPPPGAEGHAAACLGLAGDLDAARGQIDSLPRDERAAAAMVVFDVAHPVADAGDDASAGPMMELTLRYHPNHYMALYHAGMAAEATGRRGDAHRSLARFVEVYGVEDGWRANALTVLARPL